MKLPKNMLSMLSSTFLLLAYSFVFTPFLDKKKTLDSIIDKTYNSQSITIAMEDSCRYQDSLFLVHLFEVTNGDNWTYDSIRYDDALSEDTIPNAGMRWDFNTPISTWHGVELNENGCVRVLALNNNNLKGDLIDLDLPDLERFSCSNNMLTGTIPDFSNLSILRGFSCADNSLTGTIPDFDSLLNLEGFDCSKNSLIGSIPDFAKLPKLKNFSCSSNSLEDTIPNFLSLPSLEGFNCAENSLTGTIPDFSKTPNLKGFNCGSNSLEGEIPSEIGDLVNLNSLIINDNQLTGEIPSTLGYLENLKRLYFQNNELEGCFPEALKFFCSLDFNSGTTSNDGYNFTGNPLLPWEGNFSQFCQTDGSEEAQVSASCDDGNPNTQNDTIKPNCTCRGEIIPDCSMLANNIIGHYYYNNNLLDNSIIKNDGINFGATFIEDRFGNQNSAIYLDRNSHIELSDNTAYQTTNWTISFWIRKQDAFTESSIERILSKGSNPFDRVFSFELKKGRDTIGGGWLPPWHLQMNITYNSSEDSQRPLVDTLVDNIEWHHILATIQDIGNDTIVRHLYFDGDKVGTEINQGTLALNTHKIFIGSSGNTAQLTDFQGEFDDLILYNRVVTDEEVVALYNQSKPLVITIDTVLCQGAALVANEGIGNSFLWEDGSTTAERTINENGTYTVSIVDVEGCNFSINYNVTISNHPDYESLVAFYKSTNGENWNNINGWKEGVAEESCNPCNWNGGTWFGVFCKNNRVVCLDLDDENADCNYTESGTGNELIGDLIDLNLDSLKTLFLGYNNFNNLINFSNAKNLEILRIEESGMTGPIYDFDLPKLSTISFEGNNLNDTIPSFSNSPNLSFIRINNNQLTGSLPDLGLKPIDFLRFGNNDLDGCIPDSYYSYCNKNVDLLGNSKLPWEGSFSQFCQTDGSEEAQVSAPCDDNNPNTQNDVIQSDCTCRGIDTLSCQYRDRLALIELYNATNGPNWYEATNWLSDKPLNEWERVTTNSEGCVTELNLSTNNLIGDIPDLELPNLIIFNLFKNEITSVSEFRYLMNLEELNLYDNKIPGAVPNFQFMPKLKTLSIGMNSLEGELPTFNNLQNLNYLDLSGNDLIGVIDNVLVLRELTDLRLQGNRFTSKIPAFDSQKLGRVLLDTNQFSGDFPILNLPRLFDLRLNNNNLSGCIPKEIKTNCPLVGPDGGNISNNVNLLTQNWKAYWNNGTGECEDENIRCQDSLILVEIFNKMNGEKWENKWDLNQPIDTWHGITLNDIGCVTEIELRGNKIEGELFDIQLPSLEYLSMAQNSISGSIPSFQGLPKLKRLILSSNKLTGGIPFFSKCPDLAFFELSSNDLNSINDNFALHDINWLWVGNNDLENLPDLTSVPNWVDGSTPSEPPLLVLNNKLTFKDILPNITIFKDINHYQPQEKFYTDTIFNVSKGEDLTIDLGIDIDINTNEYEWLKNGVLDTVIFGKNQREFTKIELEEKGRYTVLVTNENVPGLTLESHSITIAVTDNCQIQESFIEQTICEGQIFPFGDLSLTNSGQYQQLFKTDSECDSIINLNLVVNPSYSITIDTTICPNEIAPTSLTLTSHVGCDSIVNYNVKELDIIVDAGSSQNVCVPEITLNANLSPQSTGIWTTTSNAIILEPSNPKTMVSELEEGDNWFFWNLSTSNCINTSMDSINIIFKEEKLIANNDYKKVMKGNTININVIENDSLSGDWDIFILSLPDEGNLTDIEKGIFTYSPNDNNNIEKDSFQYRLCSIICPEQCDIGKVNIEITNQEPIFTKTPTITPDGDKFNQKLIFEDLTIEKYKESKIVIFGRYSNVIYSASPYLNDWDGTYNGKTLPDGTYFFILSPIPSEHIKGYITILTK